MNNLGPITIRFNFDTLSDMLTNHSILQEEIDERFAVKADKVFFSKQDNEFIVECHLYKATEH